MKYLEALYNGVSVRKAAHYTGISKNTSFAWRHKFLSSLSNHPLIQIQTEKIDARSITLKYSSKGRRKAPEKNTEPIKTVIVREANQLMIQKLEVEKPAKHLSQIFSQATLGSIILCKPERLFKSASRKRELRIKQPHTPVEHISSKEFETEMFNLMQWMERFRGVASKYLQQYWNWYANLYNSRCLNTETQMFKAMCQSQRSLVKYQFLRDA